jgi:hypothetical protein
VHEARGEAAAEVHEPVTTRGEIGALAAAVALAGVVFAVQQANTAPSTVGGLTASQRAALALADAPASAPASARRAAPQPARRRARPAVVRHTVVRHKARAKPKPVRHVAAPRVNTVPRVVVAPPVRRRVAPVVVRPQVPIRPRVVPQAKPAPRPAPKPKPKPKAPAGEPFVSSG